MLLVDTHAHINLHAFRDDADEVLQRSLVAGVSVINVGTEYNTSKQAVSMLENYPERVYAAIGLHPSHTYENPYLDENESASATGREVFDYEAYKKLAMHPRVVGIGECGLDYYRLPPPFVIPDFTSESSNVGNPESTSLDSGSKAGMTNYELIKKLQKDAFLKQIQLAQELDKALIIHCRPSKGTNDAYEDVLEVLRGYCLSSFARRTSSSIPPLEEGQGEVVVKHADASKFSMAPSNSPSIGGGQELRFEIHSFTGPLEVAQKFIELGGYIGLNGIITFDKTGNMETVVKGIHLERIVLETDSPYLAPVPYRGKRNEPAYVSEVAKKIAEWKGAKVGEVEKQTTQNARNLFKLE